MILWFQNRERTHCFVCLVQLPRRFLGFLTGVVGQGVLKEYTPLDFLIISQRLLPSYVVCLAKLLDNAEGNNHSLGKKHLC